MSARAAYQGAPGAFSHEACLALAPGCEPVAHASFEAAIAAVRSGDCACAVLPLRNNTAGEVPGVAALIGASGLHVLEEAWRPVHHQLLTLRGAPLDRLETVASHPMALAQCGLVLDQLGLVREPAFDTAGAAADLVGSGDPTRAVIAPHGAAALYGLVVARADIEDRADNATLFCLVAP